MKKLKILVPTAIVMFIVMLQLADAPCACGWKPSMLGHLSEVAAQFFGIDYKATRYPP